MTLFYLCLSWLSAGYALYLLLDLSTGDRDFDAVFMLSFVSACLIAAGASSRVP